MAASTNDVFASVRSIVRAALGRGPWVAGARLMLFSEDVFAYLGYNFATPDPFASCGVGVPVV